MTKKRPAKRAGHKVLESERSFRLLVQGVVDYAIYMLDPAGIVTSWNAGAERIKGYQAHEVVGQHFSQFYTPEDRAAGQPDKSLETARQAGRFEAEGWRVRKDGTRFLASVVIDAIYEDGELIGFAKITRDITERQKAARCAAESERHFRLLVSGVTDYALYMLDPAGMSRTGMRAARTSRATRQARSSAGISRCFTPTRIRQAGRPARALAIAQSEGRYEDEGWRVRKDGSFFWASVVIDAIRDDDGSLIGFAKITRDITERREAQQALEKVQRQLAEFAEDGRAWAAHRRRRPRLQQPVDGGVRPYPDPEEDAAERSQGTTRRAGHRACGAAGCGPHQAAC